MIDFFDLNPQDDHSHDFLDPNSDPLYSHDYTLGEIHHDNGEYCTPIIDGEFGHHATGCDIYPIDSNPDGDLVQNFDISATDHHDHCVTHTGQVSFGSIYNDAEIRHMQEDVSKCEYEVSNLNGEVHHHENLVSLSHGKSDYSYEIDALNKAKEQYNAAVDRLNSAKARLN